MQLDKSSMGTKVDDSMNKDKEINDIETVIHYAAKQYKEVYLVGFSLGGSKSLKYLGGLSVLLRPLRQ